MGTRSLRRIVLIISSVAPTLVAGALALGVRSGLTSPTVAVIVAGVVAVAIAITGALVVVAIEHGVLSVLRDAEATDNLVKVIDAVRAEPSGDAVKPAESAESADGWPWRLVLVRRRLAALSGEETAERELPAAAEADPLAEQE